MIGAATFLAYNNHDSVAITMIGIVVGVAVVFVLNKISRLPKNKNAG
jgi:hypothetical protein